MKLKTILKTLFIILSLGVMVYYFQKNWATLQDHQWNFDIKLLVLSAILLWAAI